MDDTLYESELVTVTYSKEERLTEMVWKKDTDSAEYRKTFQAIVEFAEKNKVNYVLSDMRKEGLVKTEDVKWLELEVLKKAIAYGVLKIALVAEDTVFSTIYAETVKRKLRESPIEVRIFGDVTSAKSWLLAE
ncbi:hypothetical protein ES705_18506 [subsurface metagenome]